MYLCLDNDEVSAETLNSDLEKISTWATKWKFTFNNTETELLNVGHILVACLHSYKYCLSRKLLENMHNSFIL